MQLDFILGTAGHIDHGKTSLIRALTGRDTDRLPEEKRRGITIEPGFAQLRLGEFNIGIVDVPGHERFIRQMLSGATGMDMVMLVVAADDSVKQQTREHLDILRLLNIHLGIIVITKCDMVQDDWLDLVEDEIRELVADTFLAAAPMVRTSATTGAGIDQLKETLLATANAAEDKRWQNRVAAPFRMAIDRSFSAVGHGAVVTGSVASGSVAVGQTVMIEPGGLEARIRNLNNHEQPVESVHCGQRAAINIANLDHHLIGRGQEIAAAGYLSPSRLLTVQLRLLRHVARPLRDRARVRFHAGTAEIMANVRMLDRDELHPGESCFAQLFLSEPAACTHQQPYVIRTESPVQTIGGGVVLDPNASRLGRATERQLEQVTALAGSDPQARLAASVYLKAVGEWEPTAAPRLASIFDVEPLLAKLYEQQLLERIAVSPSHSIVAHIYSLDEIADLVQRQLEHLHDDQPLKLGFPQTVLEQRFDYLPSRAVFLRALQRLVDRGAVDRRGAEIQSRGRGPQLSKNQRKLLDELVQKVREAGIESPDLRQLAAAAPKNRDDIGQLLELAAANGQLHHVGDGYYLHDDVVEAIRAKLRPALADGMTLSQIRELLGTTRKYAVPLAEYLDRSGFTRRQGDLRYLAASTGAAMS